MAAESPLPEAPSSLQSNPPQSPPFPPTVNNNDNGIDNSSILLTALSSSSENKSSMSDHKSLRRSPRLVDEQMNGSGNGNARKVKKSNLNGSAANGIPPLKKQKASGYSSEKVEKSGIVSFFVGDPVPDEEARRQWPWRYNSQVQPSKGQTLTKSDDDEDKLVLNVKCHYSRAEVARCVFNIGDCTYVKGKEGEQNFIGRILEFFQTLDDEDYFRVQWFFRAEDTVMKEEAVCHDKKRIFYSNTKNDNLLDCIVSKVKIVQIAPDVKLNPKIIASNDFYYDMRYSVDYSTFSTVMDGCYNLSPSPCLKAVHMNGTKAIIEELSNHKPHKTSLALLDMYSGCGGMSTGLCLGAKLSGIDLTTKWAVDVDKSACESLKINHPHTQIRNESADDFFDLLKEWDKLCNRYLVKDVVEQQELNSKTMGAGTKDLRSRNDSKDPTGELEVSGLVDICYGDPGSTGKRGLHFLVSWMGYGSSENTWEPIGGLRKCQDHIQGFVRRGSKQNILPRPGDVDILCGGPPCQGISGYNRFRNTVCPLDDGRNRQIVVFMDIVSFLKPRYVLMENVADILRFAKGSLGRYALARLVHIKYQARLGIMASGCYGLPQFRLRVFLWGAHPHEKLPPFPLPTHDVILRYGAPCEFEHNIVAYDEGQPRDLEKAVVLSDAISDLPPVTNYEIREKMSYTKPAETALQNYIRATKYDMEGSTCSDTIGTEKLALYDHRPLPLTEDDYLRVSRIPRSKGAHFRDLPGIVIGADNVARRTKEPMLMPSGKPWVPDYALNFGDGKSKRPFARLWWDETVSTVLCVPDPHCQIILHPEQDRVLTLRECARLQGFPDFYKFCGDVKERYRQIGNAVAVPVARALGYSFGMAVQKKLAVDDDDDDHLLTLPPNFSHSTTAQLLHSSEN